MRENLTRVGESSTPRGGNSLLVEFHPKRTSYREQFARDHPATRRPWRTLDELL